MMLTCLTLRLHWMSIKATMARWSAYRSIVRHHILIRYWLNNALTRRHRWFVSYWDASLRTLQLRDDKDNAGNLSINV